MTDRVSRELQRAREEVQAARALADAGFHTQAISRAYYAAFYAAEAALLVLGESRSKHAGVISAFGQLVVRDSGLDASHGRALRELFDQRNAADYSLVEGSGEDARRAIDQAAAMVDATSNWIDLAQHRGTNQ